VPRAPLFAVAALLATLVVQSAGAVVKGDQRVLVVLATSGSKPYTVEEVERTVAQAGSFLSKASFGQVQLRVDVTPWLSAFSGNPGCGGSTNRSLDSIVAPARVADQVVAAAFVDEYRAPASGLIQLGPVRLAALNELVRPVAHRQLPLPGFERAGVLLQPLRDLGHAP